VQSHLVIIQVYEYLRIQHKISNLITKFDSTLCVSIPFCAQGYPPRSVHKKKQKSPHKNN